MRYAWILWLSAVVLYACTADGDRPGVIVLPGMVESIPYDSHDRNSVTGQTLLLPPEGTVPYGFRPFPYGPGVEEAARAGRELTNPILLDGAAMETHLRAGQEGYEIFCKVCHGPAGEGDGPIIGRFPNPPSLLGEHALAMPDGQIYHVIFHGQGLMPAYSAQIREEERWRIVAYVRSLQRTATTTASARADGQESPPLAPPTDAVAEPGSAADANAVEGGAS